VIISAATPAAFAVAYESPKHVAAHRAEKYPPQPGTEALAHLAAADASVKLAVPFDALSRYMCAGNHTCFSQRFTESLGLPGPAARELCQHALASFIEDYATLVLYNFDVQSIPSPFPEGGKGDFSASSSPFPKGGKGDFSASSSPFPKGGKGDLSASSSPFPKGGKGDFSAVERHSLLAFARPTPGNQQNYLSRLVADPAFFRAHAVLFVHSVQ